MQIKRKYLLPHHPFVCFFFLLENSFGSFGVCSTFELIPPKVVNSFANFRSLNFASFWQSSLFICVLFGSPFMFYFVACDGYTICCPFYGFTAKPNRKKCRKSGSSVIIFKNHEWTWVSVSAGETPPPIQWKGRRPRHRNRHRHRFCCPCRRRRHRHREFLLLSFILLVLVSRLVFVYLHFRLSCRTSLVECVSHVGVCDSVCVCVCVRGDSTGVYVCCFSGFSSAIVIVVFFLLLAVF